jgi:branched-chain amino acid transport system permease protein
MVQASLDGALLGILLPSLPMECITVGGDEYHQYSPGEMVILGGYIAYTMYVMGIHPAYGVIVSPIICILSVGFSISWL